MTGDDDLRAALLPVAEALERLGVVWYVGGSVASSAQGVPRSTMDADLVADLRTEHAAPLAAALVPAYYADPASIAEAVARRSSFNVVHLATAFKVDVFVAQLTPYDREALRRRVTDTLSRDPDAPTLPFASPEDTILAKLDWFRRGGGVSGRQWRDVLGVLRVQAGAIDVAYLRRWAPELGVAELLELALAEAAAD